MNNPNHDSAESARLYQTAIATLQQLLDEAQASEELEPTAMSLATADASGRVSSRIVLLKSVAADGIRFFSNYHSAKAAQLAAHPQAALGIHWKLLRDQVQVRIEGRVEKLPAAESDAYFATRQRTSQIGAWASLQSETLPDRAAFDARMREVEQRFAGIDVSRPPHWGGYLLRPDMFEFWYAAKFRLHERVRYELIDGRWQTRLLFP